jgi:hypothetical protein
MLIEAAQELKQNIVNLGLNTVQKSSHIVSLDYCIRTINEER